MTLWQFGAYVSESPENAATRSRAPIIEDLLVNSKLWVIFLKYMPQGKVRDMYVAQVIQSCMANIHGVNTSKYPSSLFVTWFTKAVHMLGSSSATLTASNSGSIAWALLTAAS